MKVRFTGHYFICECGSCMLFLDDMTFPRRRIVCTDSTCPHFKKEYLELVFEADAA